MKYFCEIKVVHHNGGMTIDRREHPTLYKAYAEAFTRALEMFPEHSETIFQANLLHGHAPIFDNDFGEPVVVCATAAGEHAQLKEGFFKW